MSDAHVSPLDDEPKTPMWLPALGAALFIAVALWWAVTPSAPTIAPEPAPGDSAPIAAAAPAAAPAPRPALPSQAPQPAQAAQAAPPPSARGALSAGQVDPKVTERLRRLHEQIDLKAPGGHR